LIRRRSPLPYHLSFASSVEFKLSPVLQIFGQFVSCVETCTWKNCLFVFYFAAHQRNAFERSAV